LNVIAHKVGGAKGVHPGINGTPKKALPRAAGAWNHLVFEP